jgi:hypothetical protein
LIELVLCVVQAKGSEGVWGLGLFLALMGIGFGFRHSCEMTMYEEGKTKQRESQQLTERWIDAQRANERAVIGSRNE